jgi:uncharacterized protein YndB with AHSA1/START domain
MTRPIVMERVFPYPPERLWRALTDSSAIAGWLMENDFEPILHHEFTFRTKPAPGFDGIVHCRVIEIDEPHRLAYTWGSGGHHTVVTWTLEPVADGTRLSMEHSGFQGIGGFFTRLFLSGGWKRIVHVRLAANLEGRSVPCHTEKQSESRP